jgi:hypothetical protein
MTIEEKIAKYKPVDWVAELMRKTGKSDITIYKTAKKLGRKPTAEEVLNRKAGRPKKYL